jgi:hypothetical protein
MRVYYFLGDRTMKTKLNVVLCCLLIACSLAIFGCGKKADESKPLSEVKAEAEKMSVADLQAKAKMYKDTIAAKTGEIEKLAAKLKGIAVTEMMGAEAKKIKADMETITKSVNALKERFQVYCDKIKEKGGDLSGLKI